MKNICHFELVYEEWELKCNSLPPAYIFSSIFKEIADTSIPFKGWIYEYRGSACCLRHFVRLLIPDKYRRASSDKQYICVKNFNSGEREEYKKTFMDYIYVGNTMCIVEVANSSCRLKQFLSGSLLNDLESGYHIISTGIIKNNLMSKVFPAPVELGEWAQIETGNILLVVWGEGTVVTLEKSGGK